MLYSLRRTQRTQKFRCLKIKFILCIYSVSSEVNCLFFFSHRQCHYLLKHTDGGFHIRNVFHQHRPTSVLLPQIASAGIFHHIIDHLAKSGTLIIRAIRIADKEQSHTPPFQEYFSTPKRAARRLSGTIRNNSSVSGGTGPKRSSNRKRKAFTSLSRVNPSNSRYSNIRSLLPVT